MIRTDPHGRVVGFSHHDGSLDGVVLEEGGKTVRLHLRSSGGESHTLVLSGVRAFRMDSLREGNIVHAIRLLSADAARQSSDIPPLLRDRLGLDVSTLPTEALVLVLEPAYGAEAVAVCLEAEVIGPGAPRAEGPASPDRTGVRRTFTYAFTDTSPRTMVFDYAGSAGEVMRAEASPEPGVTLFVNRGAALVLARVFAQLASSDYRGGFHVHLREDLDADQPEALTIVFQT